MDKFFFVTFDPLEIFWRISPFIYRTGFFILIHLCKCLIHLGKIVFIELFKIITNKSKEFISLKQFFHGSYHSLMIIGDPTGRHLPVVDKFMKKMSDICENSTIFESIWIWNGWPVELEQTAIFSLIYISVINSLYSLDLYSENVFNGSLRVGMSKTISGPGNLNNFTKLLVEPVVTDCILIDDIINIADSFIILDPSSVGYLELTIFDELFHFLLAGVGEVIVPIFKEDGLSHKIFSLRAGG